MERQCDLPWDKDRKHKWLWSVRNGVQLSDYLSLSELVCLTNKETKTNEVTRGLMRSMYEECVQLKT